MFSKLSKKLNLTALAIFTMVIGLAYFLMDLSVPMVYGQTANAWNIHRQGAGNDLNFYYGLSGLPALQLNTNGNAQIRALFDIDNTSNVVDPSATTSLKVLNVSDNINIGTSTGLQLLTAGTSAANAIHLGITDPATGTWVRSNGADVVFSSKVGGDMYYGYSGPSSLDHRFGTDAANPTLFVQGVAGGNVGVGTTTPTAKLEVSGANPLRIIGSNGRLLFDVGAMDAANSGIATGYGTTYNGTAMTNSGFLQVETQGTAYRNFLLQPLGGYVGIGTTAPAGPLDVKITTNKHIGFVNWNNVPTLASFNDGLTAWDNLAIAPVGNVGLGTATPGYKLDVNGSANISGNLTLSGTFAPTNLAVSGTLTASNGGLNLNNAGTSRFNEIKAKMWAGTTPVCYGNNEVVGSVTISTIGGCSSDKRLKKNIRYFEGSFLSKINQLKPALFDLKDDSKKDVAGFIAQDVQEVFPETVYDKGGGEMLEFSPNNLIPHLTKAIQELSEKVDQQQAEIENLKKKLN